MSQAVTHCIIFDELIIGFTQGRRFFLSRPENVEDQTLNFLHSGEYLHTNLFLFSVTFMMYVSLILSKKIFHYFHISIGGETCTF